jgi:hydroxymethylpyrimidine/phosphomethylpyrimidine kinase
MSEQRKYVLTVAGFDPIGGAGLLADIKTFETHKIYGLAANTGNTIQTELRFYKMNWERLDVVLETIEVLMNDYKIDVVKTGIVPSFEYLNEIISVLKAKNPGIKIIVDPIKQSSTGFDFNKDRNGLEKVLSQIYLLTPNASEAIFLGRKENAFDSAKELAKCTSVLLKGGHNDQNRGTDILFSKNKITEFKPGVEFKNSKHGTGCILSAALAANIALGNDLETACTKAKQYIEKILSTNQTIALAYHV